jgi:hypothetical protein
MINDFLENLAPAEGKRSGGGRGGEGAGEPIPWTIALVYLYRGRALMA